MSDRRSADLQYLPDRLAIEDCVNRYARAVDRHDSEMIAGVFHPDAIDNHGHFTGTVPQFVTWVNGLHEERTRAHTHNITCHTCELTGDVAHTQSYVLWALFNRDGKTVMLGSGRYVDRLERRDGQWRIAVRRTVTEMRMEGDAAIFHNNAGGYQSGGWDRSDPSYQRPLALPPEAQQALAGKAKPAAVANAAKRPERGLDYLLDRRAIQDCTIRYSHGLDRHDEALLASVFHPGAVDNRGNFVGYIPEFVAWGNSVHEQMAFAHTHNITCHFADISGDEAHTESYVIFCLRLKDGKTVQVGGGRYLDRLEKRRGEWRIIPRRLIMDWRFFADGTLFATDDGYFHGTWDRSDISYQRPLAIPERT
jgi:ketosteroid isomerase-like protein